MQIGILQTILKRITLIKNKFLSSLISKHSYTEKFHVSTGSLETPGLLSSNVVADGVGGFPPTPALFQHAS